MVMSKREERIQELIDKLLEMEEDESNRAKRAVWASAAIASKSAVLGVFPRGVQMDIWPDEGRNPLIPYSVEFHPPMWARLLEFDLLEYYSSPAAFVEAELRIKLYRHRHIADHTPIRPAIDLAMAFLPGFEYTFFGFQPQLLPDNTPWVEGEPIVATERDLTKLHHVDFKASGIMPQAHAWYEEIKRIVRGRLAIHFPIWVRGPFGLAVKLRGYENLLVDLYKNPRFVHRLLDFLTEARIKWEDDRASFTGERMKKTWLANDEVNTPSLSPQLYEEFILPYERKLAQFYDGLYWHSCGCTTALMPLISTLPKVDVFHVGPWSQPGRALACLAPQSGVEICLNPDTVLAASEEAMFRELEGLVAIANSQPVTIRADNFMVLDNIPQALQKIQLWTKVAAAVLGG
jgi:hypothetical protein